MKVRSFIIISLVLVFSLFAFNSIFAEDKNTPGGMIPKIPKTKNDPRLLNGHVYPNWGPPCQRYTYSVIYQDKEGRKPEYMKIYFNGRMIDMKKENSNNNDYKKGVKYIYKYVPNKLGSNFYYFEASNGKGRARASIIDSPDNGPVLFESAFDKNEIALIDSKIGKKVGSYPTGKEWIGGIALSDNGKYLAAKTSKHIYLFDTDNMKKPLWEFVCEQCRIGDDVKGGIDVSGDGSKIIAAFGERIALFNKSSNKPVWMYDKAGNSYNVAISRDGRYVAAGTGGSVYFFETYISQDRGKIFDCSKVIEPPAENQMTGEGGIGKQITSSLSANSSLWEKIIEFFRNLFGEKPRGNLEKKSSENKESVCGNDLCEPSLGESKQSCSKDCSAGD